MSNPSRQQELLGRLELDKDEERKKERNTFFHSNSLSERKRKAKILTTQFRQVWNERGISKGEKNRGGEAPYC